MTSGLLAEILDALGGPARWRRYAGVDATIVSSGCFFALKHLVPDSSALRTARRSGDLRDATTQTEQAKARPRTGLSACRIGLPKVVVHRGNYCSDCHAWPRIRSCASTVHLELSPA